MSGVSDWDNEYARLARTASQLRTTGLVPQSSDVRALQQGLQRLDHSLNSLPISGAEVQRRRRLIQHLQQSSSGSNAGDGGFSGLDTAGTQQSLITQAMERQDAMIDDLAIGMGRLKNQTLNINEEARMHVNLLSDMDTNLDAAYAGLEDETRRAARLREDKSVWRLQLIVAGLSILLVLLIITGLTP